MIQNVTSKEKNNLKHIYDTCKRRKYILSGMRLDEIKRIVDHISVTSTQTHRDYLRTNSTASMLTQESIQVLFEQWLQAQFPFISFFFPTHTCVMCVNIHDLQIHKKPSNIIPRSNDRIGTIRTQYTVHGIFFFISNAYFFSSLLINIETKKHKTKENVV